ncbi:phosphatidylglycerophosphatase A [Deefgea tanakiae]|uniref:Phosphatidylglycerophosphatase A n=1 Tax=Deefgea tanakiae TaxID=2865840 RepID=A0ABX8Z926_9NEIS|nr:phosphatidylglycerophosphatase A [Deefgea tanakiae]QZA79077.1 phosphatidylglycerophosphatase A [Deefgea tanakiae]
MKKQAIVAVNARFLFSHPAHFIALGFGSGLAKVAPGTWGTIAALPLFALLQMGFSNLTIALFCIPAFALGVWASEVTGRALGVSDYGGIVIDEIVAMWLVLCVAPASIAGWVLAFVLFRLFDVLKPWPIRWLDQYVKGGFGVMIDDILAAVFAIIPLVLLAPYL